MHDKEAEGGDFRYSIIPDANGYYIVSPTDARNNDIRANIGTKHTFDQNYQGSPDSEEVLLRTGNTTKINSLYGDPT